MQYDAYVYYWPAEGAQVPDRYKPYKPKVATSIDGGAGNVIIAAESLTWVLYLKEFKAMRKVIWWLSIDNYYYALPKYYSFSKMSTIDYIKYFIEDYKTSLKRLVGINIEFNIYSKKKQQIDLHLAQSVYAQEYLINKGFDSVVFLSEYLDKNYIQKSASYENASKNDVVLYNPAKGYEVSKKLIERLPQVKFIPLKGFNSDQLCDWLGTSKVYIDFGYHPGKDRFPREAVVMGCCILTNKKGSAGYYEDIPIKDSYKFDDAQIDSIAEKILDLFKNYDTAKHDFDAYREIIVTDEEKMKRDIQVAFNR